MKPCTKCGAVKPLSDFYRNSHGRDGRRGDCKACVSESRRQRYEQDGDLLRSRVASYQARNPDKIAQYRARPKTKAQRRRAHLRFAYGITESDYDRMLAEQNGTCAICGATESPLAVDHDHETGAVRGLLCQRCNTGLGQMRDDPEILRAAADYLVTHNRLSDVA